MKFLGNGQKATQMAKFQGLPPFLLIAPLDRFDRQDASALVAIVCVCQRQLNTETLFPASANEY
ncbi:MAG: hypothetical protein BGO35_16155 [Burkholderiales bacterium 64-34]|nr:MAG: hypothetical protein BGO35_16155 [Burkholderiales bacterium 64-34]